jgi:hypothetical protein
MAHNFTQHHHWGIIEHGLYVEIWNQQIADEFLWEFMEPYEVIENTFGSSVVKDFLASGGGFEVIDIPDPVPRFHDITLRAYHTDPKRLTWICLQTR